jgi:hypothetical protein
MDVRMPDGVVIRGIPDGTPKDEVMTRYRAMQERQEREKYSPAAGMGVAERFMAGAGRQVVGRARSLGNAVGLVSDEDFEEAKKLDAPLMQSGLAPKVGGFAADVAMTLPFARGGLGGAIAAGGLLGVSNPDSQGDLKSRLIDTGVGAGLGGLGHKVAGWASKKMQERLAQAALRRAQDAPKIATLEAGQKLGLVVPPATTNPRLANRMLESFAGKEAIEQEAALHNAPIMQDAMRKFLGIPKASPMTVDTLDALRKQAGAAYDEVKGLGGTMMSDSKFLAQLQQLEGAAGSAGRSFPGLGGTTIRDTLAPLRTLQFRGDDAIDAVKALREGAKASFKKGETGLGRAQKGAADAMEDLIERNIERQVGLGRVGKDYAQQTLERFRQARTTFAKTYAVESIINRATGNVQGAKAAKLLAKGTPITGELKDVAKFAAAYGNTTREPTRSAGVNALTTLFGVEAALMGHPAPLLLPPARFAMGKALLSKPYQRFMTRPSYVPGQKIPRMAQGLGRSMAPGYFAAEEEPAP